jgi:hypothetical protein
MISIILIVAIVTGAGWFVWSRWTYWRTPIGPQLSAERSPQIRAFEAFAHGNSCLVAGQWADATAAFEQARTLDPKQPYVAERLAEVTWRQHAASAQALAAAEGNHMEDLLWLSVWLIWGCAALGGFGMGGW